MVQLKKFYGTTFWELLYHFRNRGFRLKIVEECGTMEKPVFPLKSGRPKMVQLFVLQNDFEKLYHKIRMRFVV